MAFIGIARISFVLLLCIALVGCEANDKVSVVKDPFNAADALAKARGIARGKVDSNVKVFNVLDYGAKADGKTNAAMNFIRTFKAACNFHGNAMMVIPQGNFLIGPVIFQGPCFNPSPLIIQVVGIVKGHPDISEYTGGADASDWITIQSVDGLIITGSGTFDGQGPQVWKYNDCDKNDDCIRMPATLKFNKVSNAVIRGIRSIDAKGFHMFISNSQNFRIFNVHIIAPADSPNTDGIHMSKSSGVKISRSTIATGDDCVSMIQGSKDISIKKVRCGPGHGFSIGSLGHYEDELDVSGIVVKNSTMSDTDNGVRIKTYKASTPSKASGMIFQDIIMYGVRNPIIINQEYGSQSKKEPSKVAISDVHFINIRGTTTSKVAVNLLCSESTPCKGVHLRNINLEYTGEPNSDVAYGSNCTNVDVDYFGIQNPPPCK
ncbi:hypothetical protein SLEP1_g40122 [Rubroshorea leprosula]|uniref:Polygalacturonase n=1 Tax=Rubroshorea leprosula TaxID=152421 RepID=A0AAV5L3B4_9ROSI|nr:hypothetical protein SLEP1_g40122 [Rubroshorea leprosula]